MTQELRIGPMDPTARVDARDPDVAGALTGRYGVHNNALRLIEAQAAAYLDLTPALALSRDEARTASLREDLSELEGVLEVPEGFSLQSADVRGTKEGTQIVTFLVMAPSGRTARGRVGYNELPETEARYRDSLAKGIIPSTLTAPTPTEDSAEVVALREEVARLRAEREEQAAQLAAGAIPAITHPDGSSSVPSGYPPQPPAAPEEGEPVEGYDALNSDKAEARFNEETDPEVKAAILKYELAHKNRAWAARAANPDQP